MVDADEPFFFVQEESAVVMQKFVEGADLAIRLLEMV